VPDKSLRFRRKESGLSREPVLGTTVEERGGGALVLCDCKWWSYSGPIERLEIFAHSVNDRERWGEGRGRVFSLGWGVSKSLRG